jgi:hypothetical protein
MDGVSAVFWTILNLYSSFPTNNNKIFTATQFPLTSALCKCSEQLRVAFVAHPLPSSDYTFYPMYHLTSVYCLTRLLHTLRRYTEAAELYQQACGGYVQQPGSWHPTSVAYHKNFAALQQEVGQVRSFEKKCSLEVTEPVHNA